MTIEIDLRRRQFIKEGVFWLGAITIGSSIVSCNLATSTKTRPNKPYMGIFSQDFEILKVRNPLLYYELRKLPEIQTVPKGNQVRALEAIVDAYLCNEQDFHRMYKDMHSIGKPDFRRYNSPLQALYWLFEDGRLDVANEIIENYNLERLLDQAWYSPESNYKAKGKWLRKEAQRLFDSCNDNDIKKDILKYSLENPLQGKGLAVQYVISKSRQHPEKFGRPFNEDDFDNTQIKNLARWSEYATVMERLNSVEVLDYFINKNYSYIYHSDHCYHPREVFRRKGGCCNCLAFFGKRALNSAGYNTYAIAVEGPKGYHVGLVNNTENGLFIEVDWTLNFGKPNRRSGPYMGNRDVANSLGIITRGMNRYWVKQSLFYY